MRHEDSGLLECFAVLTGPRHSTSENQNPQQHCCENLISHTKTAHVSLGANKL